MARRRYSAEQAWQRILDLADDDSGDESGRESALEDEQDIEESVVSSSEDEDQHDDGLPGKVEGRDNTKWRVVRDQNVRRPGRTAQHNVFNERVGVTRICQTIENPLDAFRLIFDRWCLLHIVNCTQQFARRIGNENWKFDEEDLEKFIGLLYLRGINNQKNFPFNDLWSKTVGCPAFNKTMSRNRAREIKRYLRFDNREDRRRNLDNDKFALISPILKRFVENGQKCYRPGPCLTIDEQLFPTKARCRFTQYMPNKPDKFGIKFWLLADVDTKYCFNIIPYLGRDETRVESLGTHVVMLLTEPLQNKGYSVTTDNFFTSKHLAELLLQKRTTITGTMRNNRRELPPLQPLELHNSIFFECDAMHLTMYQAKKNKTVCILSSQHRGSTCQPDGKKKPETVLFYNNTKFGVDMLDSMCRQFSTKSGCRRWPLAVFYNILDLAAVNSWIIYKKQTGSGISRRKFLFELSKQLRRDDDQEARNDALPMTLDRRVTCAIHDKCEKNRTVNLCRKCKKPVCGKCQAIVCVKCF